MSNSFYKNNGPFKVSDILLTLNVENEIYNIGDVNLKVNNLSPWNLTSEGFLYF